MMNCIIYEKNKDEITYFIKDCQQDGRNFIGSIKLYGVKEYLFDIKWTTDIVKPIFDKEGKQIGWNKKVSEVSGATYYKGSPVSNADEVDTITKKLIRERYSAEDELKIIRRMMGGISEEEWKEYCDYVESLVKEGKTFKVKLL